MSESKASWMIRLAYVFVPIMWIAKAMEWTALEHWVNLQCMNVIFDFGSEKQRVNVARFIHTPPNILLIFGKKYPELLGSMAHNPQANAELIELIAQDVCFENDGVKVSLARNPNCPEHILLRILDGAADVSKYVSSDIKLTFAILERLGRLPKEHWQYHIAQNKTLTADMVERYLDRFERSWFDWFDEDLGGVILVRSVEERANMEEILDVFKRYGALNE